VRVAEALAVRGILVPAIRPPTVPAGTARLRISLSSAHTLADVDALARALREVAADA
jgi:8-amino-7-oxononanoate synthase